MASENGWMPARATPDQCQWVTVPGTGVRLQLLKGQPLAILRAAAADFNAYIEPLRDADSAAWTPTNSVPTSNHLNATAMDLNWDSHKFHVKNTFTAKQMKVLREMLDFYEGTLFWAGDWENPIDEMHWQMGYGSYGNPKTQSFIDRKIRSDGYSTFRRGVIEAKPKESKADGYALAIIAEGRRRNITARGIQIALATALVESDLRMYANASVPASMNLPHDAVGSDHDSVGLFQQRCPMWGPAKTLMDPTLSAGLFYDHLARLDYNGTNSPGSYAQAVQRSAYPYRYDARFSDAVALYDRLTGTTTTTTTTTTDGGFLMALSDAEQRELLDLARQLAGYRRASRSPLRHLGEGPIDTVAGFDLNTDANCHVLLVQQLAKLGDPDSLNLLTEVANADPNRYPDRAHDRLLAQAILNEISMTATVGSAPPTGITPGVIPEPVPLPTPAPAAPVAAPVAQHAAALLPVTAEGGLLGEITALTQKIHDASATVTAVIEGVTE
jgi:hypothetical protein